MFSLRPSWFDPLFLRDALFSECARSGRGEIDLTDLLTREKRGRGGRGGGGGGERGAVGGRAEEAKFHMKEASETNEGTNQGSRAGNDGGRQTADGRMSERTSERR